MTGQIEVSADILLGQRPGAVIWGVRADMVEVIGSVSGSALTIPGGTLNDSDIGKAISIKGAAAGGATLVTSISNVTSGTSGTILDAAVIAVVDVEIVYGTRNADALEAALAGCKSLGKGVLLLPPGGIITDRVVSIPSGVSIEGSGANATIIFGANYDAAALAIVDSSDVSIRNVGFKSHCVSRKTTDESAALYAHSSARLSFSNINIDGSASAGILLVNCSEVLVGTIDVRNTMADGIHIVGGTGRVVLNGVLAINTGDDSVSVVSYDTDASNSGVVVLNSIMSIDSNARGVTVVGGRRVVGGDIYIESPAAHGLLIAYESGFSTFTPERVLFSNVEVSGVLSDGFNPVLVIGDSTHLLTNVQLSTIRVVNSNVSQFKWVNGLFLSDFTTDCTPTVETDAMFLESVTDFRLVGCGATSSYYTALRVNSCTLGQIIGFRAIGCGIPGIAGEGRVHITNSSHVDGWDNYDYRLSTAPTSAGPVVTSSCNECHVSYTSHDETNPTTGRHFLPGSVSLNDAAFVPPWALNAKGGLRLETGGIRIDADAPIQGSGGSATINLFGGNIAERAAASVVQMFNRDNTSPSSQWQVLYGPEGSPVRLAAMTGPDGNLYQRGRVNPSDASHGLTAHVGGSPEGLLAAPVGSACLVDAGSLDATLYLKVSGGNGNTGWVVASGLSGLPTGVAGRFLRSNGGTSKSWEKVNIGDSTNVSGSGLTAGRILAWDGGKAIDGIVDLTAGTHVTLGTIPDGAVLARAGGVVSYYSQAGLASYVLSAPGAIGVISGMAGFDLTTLNTVFASISAALAALNDRCDDLQTQVDGKASTSHGHTLSVSGTTGTSGPPYSVSGTAS